jgi:lipoate-protein ligase A
LTYSLVVPRAHLWADDSLALYRHVHEALVAALAEVDITARLLETPATGESAAEPFLCFQRRAAGDVVAGTAKIAGSAQRRRQGAVLQHGSVLLGRSPSAPELLGIREVADREIDSEALARRWQRRLTERLELDFESMSLTERLHRRAEELRRSKYALSEWTERR